MLSKRLNLVWMLLFQQVVFLLLTFFSCSDLVSNLRWVPRFSEKDPEIFISLFERVARCFGWPDVDNMVMLACVMTGKAQEVYSALSVLIISTPDRSRRKERKEALLIF